MSLGAYGVLRASVRFLEASTQFRGLVDKFRAFHLFARRSRLLHPSPFRRNTDLYEALSWTFSPMGALESSLEQTNIQVRTLRNQLIQHSHIIYHAHTVQASSCRGRDYVTPI